VGGGGEISDNIVPSIIGQSKDEIHVQIWNLIVFAYKFDVHKHRRLSI
jgi:hypothetical protein